MRGVKAVVYETIDAVPATVWDGLTATQSLAMSRGFWKLLEQSKLNDFDYRYVVFEDETGMPAGVTVFYGITTDIAIFGPGPLRNLLAAIRRVCPNFLKLHMLECGTPITIVSPPFARRPDVTETDLAAALHGVLIRAARREGKFLIVIRDFEPNAAHLEPVFAAHGYHWIDGLPNTYLDIGWKTPEAYLGAMRSYYRSKLVKYLKRNQAAGISHKLVENFADLAETLHAQWMIVHDSAKEFQREVLTPEFYRRFSQEMGDKAKALLFYRQGELTGHALLLQDHGELRWLYVGREVAGNDGLYLYVAQKVVETAILLGAERLEMGLTTYPVKQDLGAELVPIKFALRATSRFINPFVGIGYKLLNSVPPAASRQIFKQEGRKP